MNAHILFDKLAYVDRLRSAGLADEMARAHAEGLEQAFREEVATKTDLNNVKTELKGDIAALRAELKADIAALKADLVTTKTELQGEIAGLRAELKSDIAGLRAELKSDIADLRAELKSDMAALASGMNIRFAKVETRIDEIDKALIRLMTLGGLGIAFLGILMTALRFIH